MEPQVTNIDPQQLQALLLLAIIAAIGAVFVAIIAIVVLLDLTLRIARDLQAKGSISILSQMHWVVGIACLISFTACGPVRYLPIHILAPPLDSLGAISFGSVALWMRAGSEWIEVEVQNAGSQPVVIDWQAAQFTEPDGRGHQLISASCLAELQSSVRVALSTLRARGTFSSEQTLEGLRTIRRELPLSAWENSERLKVVIPPGNKWMEYFYPKEHIQIDGVSGWQAKPLFCNRVMVVEWLSSESFELVLPIQIDGRWRYVRIVAQIVPDKTSMK